MMGAPDPIEQAAEQIVARFEPLRRQFVELAVAIDEAARPFHDAVVARMTEIEARLRQQQGRR